MNKAVTYFLSNYDRTHVQSLLDRAANSRVAVEDARVICKTLNRKISIHSINCEIIDIPLVIARRVTQTTSGEVIVILNKYAYYRKGKTFY